MKKRFISTVLCAAMAASLVTGCGSGSGNASGGSTQAAADTGSKKEVVIWDYFETDAQKAMMTTLLDGFNASQDEYVASHVYVPFSDYEKQLTLGIASGELPDLVILDGCSMASFISLGLFGDISDADIKWDEYIAGPMESTMADGRHYGIPFATNCTALFYNKDMFDKAGITQAPGSLGEIGRIADDLVKKGGAGEPISLSIYGWFFEQFTCKQGLNYVNNGNGREAAATAVEFDQNGAGAKTLAAWKELYDKGYAPNVGRGGDAGLADFSSGKSAMTLGSTASLKQILEDVNGKFEVGTAYFPMVSESDKGGVSIGGASLWALNNEDEAKKAATWEFVKFLVSPESQAYWNAQTGYFPVTVKAHEEPVFRENLEKYPQFGTAIDQLHDSTPQSAGALLSVFPEARQVVETEIENMLNNGTSPEEAASEMAQQINKAIGEYNLLNE